MSKIHPVAGHFKQPIGAIENGKAGNETCGNGFHGETAFAGIPITPLMMADRGVDAAIITGPAVIRNVE